ncbi:hypothetical protein EYC84_004334 [Monilinia fructicola]|uniref:Uncharacterized protein n=1 Tax=Monilinia fructicola TaxID=38448 RepID=A0A5M9K001_MONFR|nr:hypothetical protein EYC84_004334 [Monilinia fructicola]
MSKSSNRDIYNIRSVNSEASYIQSGSLTITAITNKVKKHYPMSPDREQKKFSNPYGLVLFYHNKPSFVLPIPTPRPFILYSKPP